MGRHTHTHTHTVVLALSQVSTSRGFRANPTNEIGSTEANETKRPPCTANYLFRDNGCARFQGMGPPCPIKLTQSMTSEARTQHVGTNPERENVRERERERDKRRLGHAEGQCSTAALQPLSLCALCWCLVTGCVTYPRKKVYPAHLPGFENYSLVDLHAFKRSAIGSAPPLYDGPIPTLVPANEMANRIPDWRHIWATECRRERFGDGDTY